MRLPLDASALAELAEIALRATATEYPHRLDQELHADDDLRPPRQLAPSFYGCYDWHSAVHSHWLLVRLLRRGLTGQLRAATIAALDERLSAERLAVELAFFRGPGGRTSERPYGWAWLALLHAECVGAAGADGNAARWARALAPLARELGERLRVYVGETLAFPTRSATHSNTAFSVALARRAARLRGEGALVDEIDAVTRRLFVDTGSETDAASWSPAPAGDAFLTPGLAEAALLADVLSADELGAWLSHQALPVDAFTVPSFARDGADPGTVHLEGLLLSRAWSLHQLAEALPPAHAVAGLARDGADAHIASVADLRPGDGFNRAHWLPTFVLFADERLGAQTGCSAQGTTTASS